MEPARLRAATIEDLRVILDEIGDFWEDRDMGFLHQALYVHEFGETSVVAEDEDGRVLAYLLGFVNPQGVGYIHAVAVRAEARGRGLARALYDRFAELVAARGGRGLKAITGPENTGSIAFHRALSFSVEEVAGYSPSGGSRIVFRRDLD